MVFSLDEPKIAGINLLAKCILLDENYKPPRNPTVLKEAIEILECSEHSGTGKVSLIEQLSLEKTNGIPPHILLHKKVEHVWKIPWIYHRLKELYVYKYPF